MVQRFITNKAAILAAAVEPGPYIYSVQTDRISRLIHNRGESPCGDVRPLTTMPTTDDCRCAQSNVLARSTAAARGYVR